ncbi:hypothetical protein Dsin_002778 [Dipteronia sinensis]|uniref:RNase H type-1 domain-containing protein n=1 Tax=Dipteronia sinensis TaxID=43782 RepID=A0AAE0B6R8_9ROSI|nr:hypothetical protein Dsin_002778 [Dipteronia sinensis]
MFGGDYNDQMNFWKRDGELFKEFRDLCNEISVSTKYKPFKMFGLSLFWAVFKLNVDVDLYKENYRYMVGVVIRDDRGAIIIVAALSFYGLVSVDIDEAKAILKELLIVEDLGLFPLCVESDALGIVGLCNEVSNCYGEVDNIVSDVISLEAKCTFISILHIP